MNRQTVIDNIKAQFTEVKLIRTGRTDSCVRFYFGNEMGEIGYYEMSYEEIDFFIEECLSVNEWTNGCSFYITNGKNWDERWSSMDNDLIREYSEAPDLSWKYIDRVLLKTMQDRHFDDD